MNHIMGRSSSASKLVLPMIIRNNKTMNNMMGKRQQCKKHPKHRQSPGVCSLCLSDKLSKVSSSSSYNSRSAIIKARARAYYYQSSSASSSSSSLSYDSSAAASPTRAAHHRRIVSDVRASAHDNKDVVYFGKSKSMAAYVGKQENTITDNEKKKKKKKRNVGVGKIWANLMKLGKSDQKLKRVNAEVLDRKMLMISKQQQNQTAASSSSMVIY